MSSTIAPQSMQTLGATHNVRSQCEGVTILLQALIAELPRFTLEQARHEASDPPAEKLAALEALYPGFTELYLAALVAASVGKDVTDAALEQTMAIFVDFHDVPRGVQN